MMRSRYFLLNMVILSIVLWCVSCEQHNEIDLPDINRKSFSYEEMMDRKKELERKRDLLKYRDINIEIQNEEK